VQNDKRLGRRQITTRIPTKVEALPDLTLREAIKYVVVLKRAKNLKERTIRDYEINMNYLIEWITERYGTISVSEVTALMLREYVLWCSKEKGFYEGHPFKSEYLAGKRGISASSVNVRIRVIKTFFNELFTEGVIVHNPALNLALMRQDIDTVEPLTEDELNRLLKAPNQKYFAQFRDYIIMMTIIDTGMRINEICSLVRTEIDVLTKRITLPAVKNKNRKSRILPISTQIARLLKKLISESDHYFESPYVFTTNYGEPLNEKTIQKALSKYAEKAKIDRSVSPHVLRHNFATMSANNGMSVFHLMKMLGHSDIKTTRKYVQVSDSDLFEQHRMYSPLARVFKRSQDGL
jgi:integrase/recombinase XerD